MVMGKHNEIRKTDFLLPNNNFLIGMGSILNLVGSYFEYNYSDSSDEADLKALESDWQNIGADIKDSIISFKESESDSNKKYSFTF